MSIYSEDQDPNEREKTSKEIIIEKINDIIKDYGSFSIADVDADHSPSLPSRGKLVFLGEDFDEKKCTVYVYEPSSFSSDEIDTYEEDYEAFDEDQLEYILELCEKWVEYNAEDEE